MTVAATSVKSTILTLERAFSARKARSILALHPALDLVFQGPPDIQ
jgi:hypothetical protein